MSETRDLVRWGKEWVVSKQLQPNGDVDVAALLAHDLRREVESRGYIAWGEPEFRWVDCDDQMWVTDTPGAFLVRGEISCYTP